MNRRTFTQSLAATAGLPILSAFSTETAEAQASSAPPVPSTSAPPFPLSVMLWTVFNDLPFEDRIAKVAEAGYTNIELVGEYRDWTDANFARANAARKRLGIKFDATAGLKHGIADPVVREAFLAELKQVLTPMETLACPAMIVLSGNVVPSLTREAQHQASIETLKQAAALVDGKQIDGQPVRLLLECIHLEENPNYFLTSANEAIEIVRAVNHPQVQFLFDIFHEQMSYGDLISKLDKHIDVVGLIHVADVPGRHQPGTGEINYVNIYRKLVQLNYRHKVAMEFRPEGDPVATLRAAKDQVSSALSA